MTHKGALARFFPPPLVRILLAAIPIIVVCYFAAGLHDRVPPPETMTAEAITLRLQPVAQFAAANTASASTAAGAPLKGKAVYEAVCVACHGEGIAGAPKFGDRKAWANRIAKGFDTLVEHALDGYTGKSGMMPPKGGGANEDVEVARAVAYMADAAGASFAEPATLAGK